MEIPIDFEERLARLVATEREYRVTVVVLAVVIEQLLKLSGGSSVEISDENLADAPDLKAWRDEAGHGVLLSVSRG